MTVKREEYPPNTLLMPLYPPKAPIYSPISHIFYIYIIYIYIYRDRGHRAWAGFQKAVIRSGRLAGRLWGGMGRATGVSRRMTAFWPLPRSSVGIGADRTIDRDDPIDRILVARRRYYQGVGVAWRGWGVVVWPLPTSAGAWIAMAERVESMPTGEAQNAVYPWAEWMDGGVWALTQSVEVPANEAYHMPAVITEGDFSVSIEKMRAYCKNAGKRRSPEMKVITRTRNEVGKLDDGREYAYKVMYVQAVPMPDAPVAVERGLATPAPEEQLTLPVDDVVAAVEADEVYEEVAMGGQSFTPGAAPAGLPIVDDTPEDEGDDDEWEEVQ